MTITTANGKPVDGLNQAPFEPIAVIGMAALMPDADTIEEFWQNIIDAHVSIKEVDKIRWDPDIYWENGAPGNITEGKTYSKIGGFVASTSSSIGPRIGSCSPSNARVPRSGR